MSKLTSFSFLSLLLAFFLPTSSFAEETVFEKSKKLSNSSVRAVKKGAHRVEEALCMGSDIKCAASKTANRVIEAKDTVIDGAEAAKEKLD